MPSLTNDYRAILQAKPGKDKKNLEAVYGDRSNRDSLLRPIWETNGMLMPYTPMIQVSHAMVDYTQYSLPQTNFDYFAYARRASPTLSITAMYTAQDIAEAKYMLSVIHFLRTVTMSYYGTSNMKKRGIPPPTLLFSAYGPYMYERVPVLIRNVSFGLEQDVDYVPAAADADAFYKGLSNTSNTNDAMAGIDGPAVIPKGQAAYEASGFEKRISQSYVPAVLNIFLDVVYAPVPSTYRDNFDLDKFRDGSYLDGGNDDGTKGFI
jgi:hypothetical protein